MYTLTCRACGAEYDWWHEPEQRIGHMCPGDGTVEPSWHELVLKQAA